MKLGRSGGGKKLPLALLAALTGCVGPAEAVDVLLWEGTLVSRTGFTTIGGSVAMVANEHDTQVGIGVNGAQPNARLGWAVRTGTCTGTGVRVAGTTAYPALAVDTQGDARAEMVIRRRLDGNVEYASELFANSNGSGAVLACADMRLKE